MALDVHTSEMAGDILVFLTGWLKLLRPRITLFFDSDNICGFLMFLHYRTVRD